MKKISKWVLAIGLTLSLYSCGSSDEAEVDRVQELDFTEEEEDGNLNIQEGLKKLDEEFPSPLDFVSHINQAKLTYDASFLNKTSNCRKYLYNSTSASINLGVYLSDLGYNTLYFKSEKVLEYFNSCKKLSDKLSIINAENEIFEKRYNANLNNRDSLLNLVREEYFLIDNNLKSSNRTEVAMEVLAGSWVEGLYISAQAMNNMENLEDNKDAQHILKRIGGQKRSLTKLVQIFRKSSNPKIKRLVVELKELQKIYDEVDVTIMKDKNSSATVEIIELNDLRQISKQSVVKKYAKVKISMPTLHKISVKIGLIRNNLVLK